MCCNYVILKYFVSGWSGVVGSLANPSWFFVFFIVFKIYLEGYNNWLTGNIFDFRINLGTRKLHQRGRRGLKENRQKRQTKSRQRTTCLQKMGKLKLRRWSLEGWVWVLLLLRSWGVFPYQSFLTNEIFFFLGLERVLSENPELILAKLRWYWQTLLREGTGGCRDKVQQLMSCCCWRSDYARWVLTTPQCQSGWTFWNHWSGHSQHPPLCIIFLECDIVSYK